MRFWDSAAGRAPAPQPLSRQPDAPSLRRPIICSLFLCLFLLQPQPSHAGPVIRVGTYANAPLVFRDAGGAPQGIYIDLLEDVAKQEGWSLLYMEGSWDECLERLQRGEIDLLLAIGFTPERSRRFDFTTQPVVVNWGQVYVRRDSPIRSPLDLTDRTLAVLRGDVYYESLKSVQDPLKLYPKFVEVDTYLDTLRLLAEGKADAALVPRIFGAYHERGFDIQRSTIMFSPTELRFAAPKGKQPGILAALDRHLTALKADKRSIYYRSLTVWTEGVRILVFPKWLDPFWLVSGVAATTLLIVGMNLLLRRQVRLRTEALRESLAAQEKAASELRIARDIQMSFVPEHLPAIPGYEIAGSLQPARAVGGDFYDCFLLDSDHLYFVLGDVSGKGVPAALFMAVTKTLLGAAAPAAVSPGAILAQVNSQAALQNAACMLVTVFCGILELRTGRVSYANAGHNPPVVLRSAGGLELLEYASAPALGVDEASGYSVFDVTLGPGDSLFLYTDGVTEAMDRSGELFSEDRLRAELSAARPCSAQALAARMLQRVEVFTGEAPQTDDIAVLVVQREPEREPEQCAPASA